MRNNTTLSSIKPTSRPRQLRAFDSKLRKWKGESLEWLREKKAEGVECTEGHTVWLKGGYLSADFVIFVVAKSKGPIRPLPPRICFDHFEIGAASGHHVRINLDESPPKTEIMQNFWQRGEGQGETPYFERYVQPLIDELIARFSEGESWVS